MDNRSQVSDISDRSLSNFTQFSEENLSQISEMGGSKMNIDELIKNPNFSKQIDKIEFWQTYNSLFQENRFGEAYTFLESFLRKLENVNQKGIFSERQENEKDITLLFLNKDTRLSKMQKNYYISLVKCCMAQCLYYSDGESQLEGQFREEGFQIERSLELLDESRKGIEGFLGKGIRLLKLKILTSLAILAIKTENEVFARTQRNELKTFLISNKDEKNRVFELRCAIKMVLGIDSVETILKEGSPAEFTTHQDKGFKFLVEGIRHELVEKYKEAVDNMNEAVIFFKEQRNWVMMCVTLGHLINIHRKHGDDEFVGQLELIQKGVAKNLQQEIDPLLEFVEKKIELAKVLINELLMLERENREPLERHSADEFARLAVTIGIRNSLKKLKRENVHGREELEPVIKSLEDVQISLQDPSNELVLQGVEWHSFVKTSVARLKNAVLNIHGTLNLAYYARPFQKIKEFSRQVNKPSFIVNRRKNETSTVQFGQYSTTQIDSRGSSRQNNRYIQI